MRSFSRFIDRGIQVPADEFNGQFAAVQTVQPARPFPPPRVCRSFEPLRVSLEVTAADLSMSFSRQNERIFVASLLLNSYSAERCRMRLLTPLTVFVVAILVSEVRTSADEASPVPPAPDQIDTVSATSVSSQQYSENGFDQYRQEPNLGAGSSPSYGFKHFPFSMHMFTTWHRPKASTLTAGQRCAPDSFRPRGLGHLFARPCDSFRMDYSPHILADAQSKYGPSYIYRHQDPRCDDCDHSRR